MENFHRFEKLKHSTVNPKAFTEKGLYMLATILKSPQAIQATISIIERFCCKGWIARLWCVIIQSKKMFIIGRVSV